MTKKSEFEVAADALSPPYNFYVGRNTSDYALVDFAPSMTKQDFVEDSDVNNIIARFTKTGVLPQYADRAPFYVDADGLPSFHEMQNILISAREGFMSLPSDVRAKFDNDPVAFAQFAVDPENVGQLREWDMLSPEAVERLDAAAAAKAAEAAEMSPGGPKAAGDEAGD